MLACVLHLRRLFFWKPNLTTHRFVFLLVMIVLLVLVGCGAAAQPIVPTARPTQTLTPTLRFTNTPDPNATPTATVTFPPRTATFGPTPTPLFGAAVVVQAAVTQPGANNPNAPRIEFFTTDVPAVAPGESVTLYWSIRNVVGANIYRVVDGVRNQVWNVGPDGSLAVPTRRSDRGSLELVLLAGEGTASVTQSLIIPLACPDTWFFQPAPDACPRAGAQEAILIEQTFERGRMVFVQASNSVYALFNDGRAPAWIGLPNRYDAAIHPEYDAEFANAVPPGFYQPLRILGYVWRGSDTARNRLGLATQPELAFTGFVQTAGAEDTEMLYVTSADGGVLQLLPQGEVWQIITPS